MEMLPPPLSCPPFKKKNSWIVWLIDREDSKVRDVEVYETFPDQPAKLNNYLKFRLNGEGFLDLGSSSHDWDKWTFQDVIFYFGFRESFKDKKLKIKLLKKLANIEEFRADSKRYLKYFGVELEEF